MANNLHRKIIYYTSRAIEAHAIGRTAVAERNLRSLEQIDISNPLHLGYRQLVRAMVTRESTQRIEQLHEAYALFMEARAHSAAAVSLLNIGCATDTPRHALPIARQAYEMFRQDGDIVGQSKALSNMGANYLHLQEYDNARKTLLTSIEVQQSIGDIVGVGVATLNLAACCLYTGETAKALYYSQESISCFQEYIRAQEGGDFEFGALVWQPGGWSRMATGVQEYLANAFINYGNALGEIGEHERAIDAFIESRALMHEIQNSQGEGIALNQIGDTLLEQGDYAKAEEYFRLGKNLFEESGTRGYKYGVVLQGIGEACTAQRKFDEGADYYRLALQELADAENRAGEAEILLLMGESRIAQQEYAEAVSILKEGLILAQSIAAIEIVIRCNRALGSAMMHLESSNAREYLLRALLQAEECSMKVEQQNIHRELASYYKLVGESTDALAHFEKFYLLQREIFTENADRRLKNFETLHNVELYKRSLSEMADKIQQIESELEEKRAELGSLAARIMEKQEFVRLVESGLTKLIKACPDRKDHHARELLEFIRTAGDVRSDWDELSRKFLSVHRDFSDRLMALAPTLTQAEFQVCVLLRLSMRAKQIANVLKIEPKTVYNHRQNIRNKLCLTNHENLTSHLIRLDGNGLIA